MKKRGVQAVLLLVSVALIGAGLAQGDMGDVLKKATRVCMECIGLG